MKDSIIRDKALEAGLNRFPEHIIGTKDTLIEKDAPIDSNLGKRIIFIEGFIEGYKQSQKDNII